MARKFLTAVDLGKNELQNAAVQNLGSAPSTPVKGQLYFNSGDNTLYWWDGTAWASARGGGSGFPGFGAVTQEQTFGTAKNDGVGTTTARNDHAHGNPVHDNAAHSAITLNSLAAPTAAVSMNGQRITNVATPTSLTDAPNKSYVDNLSYGMAWKEPVRAATIANITLSGLQTIDGVALTAGQRVLVKNQTTASANGIYEAYSTAWTRTADADEAGDLENAAVFVSEGTTLADTAWVMTANPPLTVGTTNLTWVQFAGGGAVTAGAGLTQTGNTIDVGAGTGITVAADSVALDTTYADGRYALAANGAKRFAANVAAATSTAITHNLNTRDVVVNVYRVASPYDTVECDVERTDLNNVTVRFATAPAASEYRCVVLA
jgi:hypothetical protein